MHIPIDPAASEPIYEQIRTGIAEAIVSGRLAPGEALPSIRSLARDLRVSVITTTRAYNELVSDGLVVPQQGRGVFVRDQPTGALQERARTRISEALDEATRTARQLATIVELRLGTALTEDEVSYLALHVARMTLDAETDEVR